MKEKAHKGMIRICHMALCLVISQPFSLLSYELMEDKGIYIHTL